MTDQILTVHTFVVALWNVGSHARNFALGVVAVATIFIGLWVGIGNGTHRHYETPTPVCIFFALLRHIADLVWLVLVLDWPWVRRGTFSRGIYLALDCFICLSDNERLPLFLDQGRPLSRPSEDAFVSLRFSVVNAAHKLASYPLAFAIIVLPVTIARWSLFNHKDVSSAATFFAVCVFNLSGAVNVLLFLSIRPQLLLFTPPAEDLSEPEAVDIGSPVDTGSPTAGSAILNDAAGYNHSPEPTGTGIVDDGNVALARIESRSGV